MPAKTDGMLFEVHPTPAKGADGRNIVYVRPAGNKKMSVQELEDFCCRNLYARYGELSRAFELFIRAAGELMASGYRIDTPIGSFAPRLKLTREITDPDDVKGRDVVFDGVDYNPGKLWNKELSRWSEGFRRAWNPDTMQLLQDTERLEQLLQKSLDENEGYTTARRFARASGLTNYSARKLLNEWCEGDNPKLLKTRRGQEYIYTEV